MIKNSDLMKNLIMIPHIMDEKELNTGGMRFAVQIKCTKWKK